MPRLREGLHDRAHRRIDRDVPLHDQRFETQQPPRRHEWAFFAKGMDGRIDNPNAVWKGKAIYTSRSTRAPFHGEGGKGETSKLVKFQVRPTSLSK